MMASAAVVRLVEALHASPVKLSACVCGAGSTALAVLTQVPGCSHTLLQAEMLYSPMSTAAVLDYMPAHFVSAHVARHLAQHALATSQRLQASMQSVATEQAFLVGLGATSAVQTTRQRRGVDQAFVSCWARPLGEPAGHTRICDAHLELPGELSRSQQDEQVALLILHTLGQLVATVTGTAGGGKTYDSTRKNCGEATEADGEPSSTAKSVWDGVAPLLCNAPAVMWRGFDGTEASLAIAAVLDGRSPFALFNRFGEPRATLCSDGILSPEDEGVVERAKDEESETSVTQLRAGPVRLLYPGSFRPLHWGHTELARAALAVAIEARAGHNQAEGQQAELPLHPCGRVTYELAATVADKGAVSAESLAARVAQFTSRGERVAVTGATLFVGKAALFPAHGFIVGVDTARRILDPKYYPGGTETSMIAALRRDIGGRGCYFVVGGRALATPLQERIAPASESRHPPSLPSAPVWEDLSALRVPSELAGLFLAVPESRFRVDVSSTELRARVKNRQLTLL